MLFQRTLGVSVSLAVVLISGNAHAFSRGVSFNGCSGCHGAGEQTAELIPFGDLREGEAQEMRLVVNGEGEGLGLFIRVEGGTITPGAETKRAEAGITHDGPLRVSGDSIEVQFGFTPTSGAVRFSVSTLMTNGDRGRGGDRGNEHVFDFVVGCEGELYYQDQDTDGWGGERTRLFCAGEPGENYVSRPGDCDDFWDAVHPEAEEPCNQRDDNCNDIIDDDAEEVTHYPDSDRDGFYSRDERQSGEEFFGCSEPGGRWASRPGDCAPDDEERNPDAEEVCDLFDNDCDGDVDERTRPQCGTGWCRRNSSTCDVEDCEPGPPQVETCNLFDDDCDGIADEGTCPAGQSCIDFECTDDSGGPGPGPGPGPGEPPSDDGGCSLGATGSSAPALTLLMLVVFPLLRRRR
ncbi:MAG: MYXO-CTERM domain-containing protein [Polyangiales bacterium]